MPSKYLYGFYGFFTLGVAVCGILSIIFSFLWRRNDLILNMTFSHSDLNGACWLGSSTVTLFSRQGLWLAGLAMGIALLLTSFVSVGAIIQRNHVTIGLVLLNWLLIADAVIVLVVGTFVWFFTLRERSEYHSVYAKLQPSQRVFIQDQASQITVTSLFVFVIALWTAISFNAADISTPRISFNSAEAFAKTPRSLIHSTRPLRAISASRPSLTMSMSL
jgi:hypothetical protein